MNNLSSHETTLAAFDWKQWWLPANYAEHGGAVDLLFYVIFLVTAAVGLAVLLAILYYCIRYRHRPGLKAHFTHGNKKLELTWTIIPAILLIGLALWTKAAWDRFRYASEAETKTATKILVIAERFNWNTIYPGPDGEFGRYLVFPKTTDPKWPALPEGQEGHFANTYAGLGENMPPLPAGPAFLPPDQAKLLINDYISMNPLGKDFSDPKGVDDDWRSAVGRPVYVPKGKLVRVELTSKDVIHDFFLPHFRVKLDAVPGMRGTLFFTPTMTSVDYEKQAMLSKRTYTLDEARHLLKQRYQLRIVVPEDAKEKYTWTDITETTERIRGRNVKVEKKDVTVIKTGDRLDGTLLDGIETRLGHSSVEAYVFTEWEVVCEELCGNGHTVMQGRVIVLTPEEYAERFEKPAATTAAPAEPADKVAAATPAN